MNRRNIVNLSAIAALGLGLLPGGTIAQTKSLKDQLVGTWTLTSIYNIQPDGTRLDANGPSPIVNGTDGKREVKIAGDEMQFVNKGAPSGGVAYSVWSRAK
jgi:hypothetical protein